MDPKLRPIPLHRAPPRSLAALLTLTIVGSALLAVLLSACGGGGGGGAVTPPTQQPTAVDGTLAASKPGELLEYVKAKLRARQSERAAQGANGVLFGTLVDSTTSLVPTSGGIASASDSARSGTTVQEAGVDEDDVIKSDGSLFVTLARAAELKPASAAATLGMHRRLADGSPQRAGSLALMSDAETVTYYRGLYWSPTAQRAAVLGEEQLFYVLNFCDGLAICDAASILPYPRASKPSVVVDHVGTADPAAPALREKWRIDGRVIGSRLIGNSLVLVTQFSPQLAVDVMPWNAPAAERDAQLAKVVTAELLPTIRINGGAAQPLVTDTDCYVEPKNASFGIEVTTITTVDLSSATLQRRSRCFIGGSEALYMSPQALYLATTRWSTAAPAVGNARVVFPSAMSMDVHKFALAGGTVDYRGSGNVPGHLGWDPQNRSYRFSEHNADLRVLSFTGQTGWGVISDAANASAPAPSPATLSVLRERTSDRSLQTVATLPNSQRPALIGKANEQVYAVRFVGDRGYVVTFRRTDPLYVLDLSNPSDPKTVGELEVAGFSTYLFPMGAGGTPGANLLLGVGRDADARGFATGVKLALFDVSDPARPTQRASVTYGSNATQSGLDVSRHGIDLLTRGNQTRIVLPMSSYSALDDVPAFSLQRFEVDAGAKSMTAKPALATSTSQQFRDLGQQRTLQIGEQVYFWDGQQLRAYTW